MEIPNLDQWLQNVHAFTAQTMEQPDLSINYNWIYYLLKFWENITFKWICKNNNISATEMITDIFEKYVCYLAKNEPIDGYVDSVLLAEKLESISVIVKVDLQSCMSYIIDNLTLTEQKFEEAEFWEERTIQKSSWIILVAAEILKADQKVIHRKILHSRKKSDLLTDSLNELTLEEKSKVFQISSICSKVFCIINKLKNFQTVILKMSVEVQNIYIILERSFWGFLSTFIDIYFLCSRLEDDKCSYNLYWSAYQKLEHTVRPHVDADVFWSPSNLKLLKEASPDNQYSQSENNGGVGKIIFSGIKEIMKLKNEDAVIEYLVNKLTDNIAVFNDR